MLKILLFLFPFIYFAVEITSEKKEMSLRKEIIDLKERKRVLEEALKKSENRSYDELSGVRRVDKGTTRRRIEDDDDESNHLGGCNQETENVEEDSDPLFTYPKEVVQQPPTTVGSPRILICHSLYVC